MPDVYSLHGENAEVDTKKKLRTKGVILTLLVGDF